MATRYVDGLNGSDANPGTESLQYATINHALTAAGAGDLIVVRGDGAIYPETIIATSGVKKNVVFEGVGNNSKPAVEGEGANSYGFHCSQEGQKVRGFEIRNVRKSGIYLAPGSGGKGTLKNQVVEGCHIHHVREDIFAAAVYGVECRYSNPAVRGCTVHHIGQGGEAKGVFFNTCNDHVADGNDIFAVRKEAIRDSVGLRGQVVNNRAWLNWSAFHIATCTAPLVANNFSYLNSVGLSVKHCNDPNFALATWGYTLADIAAGTVAKARAWHNTVYGAVSQHILFAIDNAAIAAASGYSYFVEFMNNLILGPGTELVWENPASRPDTSRVLDFNVYESRLDRRPARFAREGPSTPTFATMAALTAGGTRTQNWEVNGRELPVDLVDPDNGDLNPIVAPSPLLELASPWGSQVGARQTSVSPYAWRPETPIVVNSKSLSPTERARMTDGHDDVTTQTDTAVDEWLVIDLGAVVTFDHFRWSVFGHADVHGVHEWSLETGPTDSGPWTLAVDRAAFPDSYASEYLWELPQPVTTQFLRFTAHNNFYVTTLTADVTLPVATLPVASTRYSVPNELGTYLALPNSGDVAIGADGATRVHYTGRTESALTGCTGGTGTFPAGSRVSWRDMVFVELAVGTLDTDTTPPVVVAPIADAGNPPVLLGTVQVGQQLTCTQGAWQNGPTAFTFEYFVDGVSAGAASANPSFTPSAAHSGEDVFCRVTATNTAGSDTADTAAHTILPAATGAAPVNTQLPAVTGVPQTGEVLTGTLGGWDNSPTGYTQKWQRNTAGTWADIAGATALTYTAQVADEGKQVRLAVTATNGTGSATATSVPVTVTAVPAPPVVGAAAGRWV